MAKTGWPASSASPFILATHLLALDQTHFYYLVLFCFTIGVVIMRALLDSPLGHAWVAIRENRRRMEFLGVRTDLYVWASFAIAGLITGLAGTLNALLFNFTSPQDLHWILSGDFVMMIVLGGMRNFWGPLVGTAIFVVAQDYLSSITGNWMTFIGLIFIGIVLLFPKVCLAWWSRHEVGVNPGTPESVGHAAARRRRRRREAPDRARSCCVWNMSAATSARSARSMTFRWDGAGELRAVIGQNGAGKTTFFNLISGFFPATAGEIWFDGENIGRADVVGRVARGIVRTFQITEVFPDLSVFESIRVAVEAASGVNRRPWLPRSARRRARPSGRGSDGGGRPHRQGEPRRGRAGARRPALGRRSPWLFA